MAWDGTKKIKEPIGEDAELYIFIREMDVLKAKLKKDLKTIFKGGSK
jgi:hypothetical protein